MIELISKDKNEKFQFVGRCKLTIDSLSNLLLIEPFNEEYKMISAIFKWHFVPQKNILFVFAEYQFQDFALIFDDTKKCEKACEFLLKKGATFGIKELIHDRFLPLLFKNISESNDSNIKEIVKKWIEIQDEKEKNEYIQLLKNYHIYELMDLNEGQVKNQENPRKRKAKDITKDNNGLKSKNGKNAQKLQNQKISKRNRQPVTSTKIIESPNFEVLKHIHRGALKTTLSIFTTPDRKYCYEYFWDNSKGYFICFVCCGKKVRMSARIIKRNRKDVVQLNGTEHVCKQRIYKKIIEKPMFQIMSYYFRNDVIQRLIIFSDSSQTTCYEYLWSKDAKLWHCTGCLKAKPKRWTAADICQKVDGTDFIMLKPCNDHICEMIQFDPEKYVGKQIVEEGNFKIFKNIQNGNDRSKLVVFASADKLTCYELSWEKKNKEFQCYGCKKLGKYAAAKVYQHSDGRQYLKLSKNKHFCHPCEYEPEKFIISEESIIECSDFKVFTYKHNGATTSRLVLFDPTNKNLCYEYFWSVLVRKYLCCYCPRDKQVTAAICRDGDGKEYLKLFNPKHECDLREFDPEKYKDDIIVKRSLYETYSIITSDNPRQRNLIIFTSEEKKYYYKYLYNKTGKYFYCSKCSIEKVGITATIQNEGQENEIAFMAHQMHVCEPLEYFLSTNGCIVLAPKYELIKRKTRGKVHQHLVVFTTDEKTECYEYSWSDKGKHFKCNACGIRHKYFVSAKIVKTIENEECVQLCEKPHKCKPIKFVPQNITTKLVKLPNYQLLKRKVNGKIYQHLVVFTNDEKSECYEYTWSEKGKVFRCQPCSSKYKTSVNAKIIKDAENEDCVELCQADHQCSPNKFIPEKLVGKIVIQPGFKLWEVMFRNKKMKRITVFDPNNNNFGYTYTYYDERKYYVCNRCKSVKVTAKLLQDENGENYLELNKAEHVCKMQKL